MMRNSWQYAALAGLFIFTFHLGIAQGFEEAARAKKDVWSGYWWPIRSGGVSEPLKKYDTLASRQAAQWELENNPPGPDVPKWFGFCHAWSASAVMEYEPQKVLKTRGKTLSIGDQKAWLAASHAEDESNFFGTRYEQGGDPTDISPEELWHTLKTHIREQGLPIVADIEPGESVWNYPVYRYRVRYEEKAEKLRGTIEIWFADDAVPPNFVGLKSAYKKYEFEARTRNGAILVGSGKWVGKSVKDHPDFLWFPYVAKPENPQVDYKWIRKTLNASLVAPEPEPAPEPAPAPQPEPAPEPAPAPQPEPQPEIPTISPEELVTLIASHKSDFMLDASVDRFDGGIYYEGEALKIALKSVQSGFLYLIGVLPDGKPFMLYPQKGDDNRIEASQEVTVPGPGVKYLFRLGKQYGTYHVKAIVTDKPIEFTGWSHSNEAMLPGTEINPSAGTSFHWPPTSANETARGMQVVFNEGQEADVRSILKERFHITAFAQDETMFVLVPKR